MKGCQTHRRRLVSAARSLLPCLPSIPLINPTHPAQVAPQSTNKLATQPPQSHLSPRSHLTQFLVTLPGLRVDGLWYGSPYVKLTDSSGELGGSLWWSIMARGTVEGRAICLKRVIAPGGGRGNRGKGKEGVWLRGHGRGMRWRVGSYGVRLRRGLGRGFRDCESGEGVSKCVCICAEVGVLGLGGDGLFLFVEQSETEEGRAARSIS